MCRSLAPFVRYVCACVRVCVCACTLSMHACVWAGGHAISSIPPNQKPSCCCTNQRPLGTGPYYAALPIPTLLPSYPPTVPYRYLSPLLPALPCPVLTSGVLAGRAGWLGWLGPVSLIPSCVPSVWLSLCPPLSISFCSVFIHLYTPFPLLPTYLLPPSPPPPTHHHYDEV